MKSEICVAHTHLETPLVISENFVQVLIIENPNEYFKTVTELDRQMEGEEGEFVFSTQGQTVLPSKIGVMVCDLFHFDINEKKILNLLYKKLESLSLGNRVLLYNNLNANLMAFLSEMQFDVPFDLEFCEPQPTDYFKIAGVKFEKAYDSLEEKIICYINALIELKNCEFFIFVNLKSILPDEKLQKVYEHCQLEQVGLLLIENCKSRPLLPCEKAVIITEDLCEIVENY